MARRARGEGRLDTALVVACVALAILALIAPRRSREQLASTLRTRVLAPLVTLEGQAATVRAAVTSRNAVLMARGRGAIDTLSVRAVADENATLRKLLGLAARLQDGFVPAELLPAPGGDEFTIALTAGAQTGIAPFQPVVTADGLVGMVESVDATTSYAITWAHPDFRVSAMSVDQNAFGIVQPHLGSGAERWLLEMRGVPFRAKLDSGTLVVSSGLGATYPRGIPIGTVLGEITTPEKWARTYLLKPSVLPEAIGPVLVMLPARAQRGVNGVWTTVAAADSAARAVAQAGDSLARKAAFDELAARRAALDAQAADSLAAADTIGGGLGNRPPVKADSVRPVVKPPVSAPAAPRRDSIKPPVRPGPPPAPELR
ncbi:MAG: rod shape-determining protein MreC [Gemmatimonadaceae bacterium]|nr:rod shape-determining protein MreC [Gemmatimonadaceae bacterium]